MTAQDLKNAILKLAIQGKLVPQDSSDEPVSELLKRIEAEIRVQIKAERIKKFKALSDITAEDLPFDIPETWRWIKLGNICQLLDGEKKNGVKYPYLEAKFLRGKVAPTLKDEGKFVDKGTRLILVDGENSGEVFAAVEDGYMGSTFKVLYFPQELIAGYMLYFLQLKQTAFRNNKTGSAIPHLNKDLFFNMSFPLPPLAEQQRIVNKIEELMPLVEEYGKAEERLTELNADFPDKLRKSILQQAIQGKLTERDPADEPASELLKRIHAEKERLGKGKKEKNLPPITEEEIPFEIPDSWVWVRFSSIINYMSTGPFGSMLHKSDYVNNGIPLVNPTNIIGERIIPSERMMVSKETVERLSSYRLQKGTIVMGRRGEMGRCAVITDDEEGWLCGTGSFFMEPSSLICSDYMVKFFASVYAKHYLGGESVGSTMNNLNHNILSKMPVPLPPLAEQQRIVDRVNELLAMCDELK